MAAALAASAARGGDQHSNNPGEDNGQTPSSAFDDHAGQTDPSEFLKNENDDDGAKDSNSSTSKSPRTIGGGSLNPANRVPGWGASW